MADDDYSSLRQAIEKIIGAPAGGAQGGKDIVEMAPRAPYSQDLQTTAPRAQDVSVSNTDPAAQAAAAQAAAAPVVTPAAAVAPVSTVAAAPLGPDYKSYNEYYASNPAALEKSFYLGTAGEPLGTTSGEGEKWGAGGNPYRYRNEYNKYLGTLPAEYQILGKSNITGEAVKKGAIHSVYDWDRGNIYSVGPNVAPGTVKSKIQGWTPRGSSASSSAASTGRPVNPGARAPWQASQQYWKDLAAYKGT